MFHLKSLCFTPWQYLSSDYLHCINKTCLGCLCYHLFLWVLCLVACLYSQIGSVIPFSICHDLPVFSYWFSYTFRFQWLACILWLVQFFFVFFVQTCLQFCTSLILPFSVCKAFRKSTLIIYCLNSPETPIKYFKCRLYHIFSMSVRLSSLITICCWQL